MDRDKALEAAVTQIERQFGKGSIMRMGEHAAAGDILTVPTGSLALDIALGVGGIPRGRIVEIYGPESSGKTTLVYHLIAQAQRLGGVAAFIDTEHAMDPNYARAIGVNVDDLLVSQPDYGEQALEITEMLIRSGALDIVAIDSVAALTPRAEIEGEMGDSFVGLQARLISQALRKLAGTLSKSGTICVFTNQLREKIGVMFGNPETTTGGKALKFYATIRLDIRRIETLKEGTEAVGNRVRVKVVKNKVAPPSRRPSSTSCTAPASRAKARCSTSASPPTSSHKSGAFFSYNDERLGQGRAAARQFLREQPRDGRRHRAPDPRSGGPATDLRPQPQRRPQGQGLGRGRAGQGRSRGRQGAGHDRVGGPAAGRPCRPSPPSARPAARVASRCTSTAGSWPRSGQSFVVRHGLFVGLELSDEQLSTLRDDAGADRILADAYRLLAHRARSRAELAARLHAKGHDEPAVQAVLERLSGEGLVDDQAFAAAFVADKRRLAGWGAGRIARELDRLGVDADVVQSGAAPVRRSHRRRARPGPRRAQHRGPARPPLDAARKRAFEFLVRRGYSTTVAYRTVREWSAGATD